MPKGDVHVLARMDRQDKRAERITRKLIRKLARTRRNQRAADYAVLTPPAFHSMSFASATNLIPNDQTVVAKRRLVKSKDEDGKRAFYVGEIFEVDDEPLSLLVIPRTLSSTPDMCARAITKDSQAVARVSSCTVTLLESSGERNLQVAGHPTRTLLVQKVHVPNGLTLFYAGHETLATQTRSEPWSLGLDSRTTKELQKVAAGLLGAQLVRNPRL